jgi:hypothetical protein
LGEQPAFALAQSQCGLAGKVMNLRHRHGEDSKTSAPVKQ